jgi:hypothetical protein
MSAPVRCLIQLSTRSRKLQVFKLSLFRRLSGWRKLLQLCCTYIRKCFRASELL